MNNPKYYKLLLLISCLVLFFSHLHVLPVTIMEARNFITAREMLTDGNWILTTMNGLPRYEKPPLPTWLSALSALLFGIKNIAAYRLPTAIMATFTIFTFYNFVALIFKQKKLAFISALILASSFYVIAIQREAPWDIYTHGFMLASIYFLYRLLTEYKKPYTHALWGAFFFGLSFLSKGPISFYGLFLSFLIAFGFAYKFKAIQGKIKPLLVYLILGLAIGGWWFVWVRYSDPEAFIKITQQETSRWGSYNVRPFYYYWSFFTQSGIWTIPAFVSLLYPYLKNKVSNKKGYLFSFTWTLAVVILLSVIPEKKSRYLLPVLIPLALNTGFYISYLINNFKSIENKKEKIPVYINFTLIALIGFLFPVAAYIYLKDTINGMLWYYYAATSLFLVIIAIYIVFMLLKKNIYAVFLANILFIMVIIGVGLPLSKTLKTNSEYKNITSLKAQLKQKPLYHFGSVAPEMIWYYGDKISSIKLNPEEKTFYVLVGHEAENSFKKHFTNVSSVKFVTNFDLNFSAEPGTKKHRERLTNKLYLITK